MENRGDGERRDRVGSLWIRSAGGSSLAKATVERYRAREQDGQGAEREEREA